MDAATKRAIDQLTGELLRTQAELATVKRGQRRPQLGSSSIDRGALEVRDPDTLVTRIRIGYQPDGSVGVVPEGGDPHPAPATPFVAPIPSGLSVTWDGSLDGLDLLPADFDHINVHVSQDSGFAPSPATFSGTIPRSGGALPVAPLEVGTTYYVVLVPVGTGGVQGEVSDEASGVPTGVTDIEPGSITEVEIADDAISAPKIQAEAIQALHIAADQIEAGHIQASAVTASKLEADLVLGTRIIAGDPGGARVELDDTGLRGYTGEDELAFVIDDQGNAVFSGAITGSEITGSRMTIAASGGATGVIEEATGGVVRNRVTSAHGSRAQLSGTPDLAQLAAWADVTDSSAPTGAISAQPDICAIVLYSNPANPGGSPAFQMSATPDEANAIWQSETGSSVRIRSREGSSSIALTAPAAEDPDDHQGAGFIFAQRYSDDLATASMQGPVWGEGDGPERGLRAMLHLEGSRPDRAYTRMTYAARRHVFGGEYNYNLGQTDQVTDGALELRPAHSILAPRHAPLSTVLTVNPAFSTSGSYVDFTTAQMPTVPFRTGWSGRVKISLMSAGLNNTGPDRNLRLAFRLSGAQTIAAAPERGTWMTNSGTGNSSRQMSTRITVMNLQGNADYTLHPQWYSSENGGAVNFSIALGNTIIIEPLM